MKKRIIVTLFLISAISLIGCTKSPVEKKSVVVKDSKEAITSAITVKPTSSASEATPTTGPSEQEANAEDNSTDTDETFPLTIQLEGTEEIISAKKYQSKLGYQMFYDVNRFTVTDSDGIDLYTAPNSDPDIYPYIYLNISRNDIPTDDTVFTKVTNDKSNLTGYIANNYYNLKPGDKDSLYGYILTEESSVSPIDTVRIGEYEALHYTVINGKAWNSPITEFFYITTDQYIYSFTANYYTEAAEGFGVRIHAMMDTFKMQ